MENASYKAKYKAPGILYSGTLSMATLAAFIQVHGKYLVSTIGTAGLQEGVA